MASHLALIELSKRFARRGAPGAAEGQAAALHELSLEVEAGELLVLVGPSGCGKSTALRLVAGLDEPSAGRVELDGTDLAGVPPARRDVAMVFQGYALYPHMTAGEIIAFPLKMQRVARAEREKRAREVAELVGLGDKLDRLPSEMSGGERQRVAMARAIVRRPKLFLFDEPLSNLDAKLRAELRVELAQLVRRTGVTSIYVTHDQAEAMTMGDRIAVMSAGRLVQVGAPRAIYERPASRFVAEFVGTPAINLVDLADPGGVKIAAAPERVGAAAVAFRPEGVKLNLTSGSVLSLTGKVAAIEPLGAETIVHLDAGGVAVRARAPGFSALAPGAAVSAGVAEEDLHWFDASGARVEAR